MGGPAIQHRLEANRRAIIAAYEGGSSLDEVAADHAVSSSSIRRFLLASGIKLRPQRRQRVLESRAAEVEMMYRAGANTREIAELLGVDRNTVSQFLAAKGLRRAGALGIREFFIETEGDKGLLAGILLGEGSVVIRASGEVLISIANTDPEIIEWVSRWGGRVYWYAPNERGTKPAGTWRLSRAVDVYHCLMALLPYLFGKKRALAERGIGLLEERHGLSTSVGGVE